MSHIEAGVKIILETRSEDSPVSKLSSKKESTFAPLSALSLIFIRLDSQIYQMGPRARRRLTSPKFDDEAAGYQPDIPPVFFSLEEARNSLDYIWTACVRSIQDYPELQLAEMLQGPRLGIVFALDLIRNFPMVRSI